MPRHKWEPQEPQHDLNCGQVQQHEVMGYGGRVVSRWLPQIPKCRSAWHLIGQVVE